MREQLAKINGVRRRFQGEFVRFGEKSGYHHPLATILLKNIIDLASGRLMTDHLWFNDGKGFERLSLKEGDIIRFDARVTSYLKGYLGKHNEDEFEMHCAERDYRLSFPNNFVKVSAEKSIF